MLVRYRNGLKLKDCYCSFCGARRDATVFREKLRWMIRLKCGHIGFRGWVLPPEQLEKMGLLNEQLKEHKDNQKNYTELAEKRALAKLEHELWRADKRGSLEYDMQRWKDKVR